MDRSKIKSKLKAIHRGIGLCFEMLDDTPAKERQRLDNNFGRLYSKADDIRQAVSGLPAIPERSGNPHYDLKKLRQWTEQSMMLIDIIDILPLTNRERDVLKLLCSLEPNKAMIGPKIADILTKKTDEYTMYNSDLTSKIIPKLKKVGVRNKKRIGYFIEPEYRRVAQLIISSV